MYQLREAVFYRLMYEQPLLCLINSGFAPSSRQTGHIYVMPCSGMGSARIRSLPIHVLV